MVKIDLITGFLGSGKTTFLKKYVHFLLEQGMNIGILENDFGAVNVDTMLVQELMGENCEVEMVAGGCDWDCHRRRFKTKLIAMGMCGYDRVIVEPSGIFEVDEFFEILREDPLERWYEIGNVFTIVNAKLETELSEQSEYLLGSQVAQAGKVILSRTQNASIDEIQQTISHINQALQGVHCQRVIEREEVQCVDWSKWTKDTFLELSQVGYERYDYGKMYVEHENDFQSVYLMNAEVSLEELKARIPSLWKMQVGNIFRIKGFVQEHDGTWYEINATREEVRVAKLQQGQQILIVIGEKLEEQRIKDILEGTN